MRARAALLGLAILLGGCGEERAVGELVRRYNDEAIRAYGLNDASRMPEVATRKEADRVLVLVDLKASNRLVLEAKLEQFTITSTKVAKDRSSAVVETEERWRYFDRPLVPGRQPGQAIVSEMAMRYDCVKEAGRWKVSDVSTIRNEILEPKGYALLNKPSGPPRDAGTDAGP